MKVILTADVKAQGKKGDLITVADGYGSFLIKSGMAEHATSTAINSVNLKNQAAAHHKQVEKQAAIEFSKKINETPVTIKVKVGANGKLFGALNTQSIADAMKKSGLDCDKKKIVLKEPIKLVGLYKVNIKVYPEISATLNLTVENE